MNHRFTEEEVAWMYENVPGHHWKDIIVEFNQKFNTSIRLESLRAQCLKRNILTGFTGRYEKGSVPHNKGVPMPPEVYEKCKRTMFKPRSLNGRAKDVFRKKGDITIEKKDGYEVIKVDDKHTWQFRSRYEYERFHNRKLNKNEMVIFLDGNCHNFSEDNLFAITNAECMRLNQMKLRKKDKDMTLAGVALVRLIEAMRKKQNE